MKKVYFVLFGFISVISFHCQKELNYVNLPGSQNLFLTVFTLQGNVLDENGQPAIGVEIKAGDRGTMTDASGYFRIANASFDKTNHFVTAEKAGYFKAYRSFIATTGVNQVIIKLVKKEFSGQINSISGGDATLPNGSKITLPANGIVNSSGGSYLGTFNVYASYIDPSARDISQTIPGSFIAVDKSNKRVALTSYGMLAVELESLTAEKLQIAPGNTATLTIPVPPSIASSAPSTISLWYVNELTGTWQEEGTAQKVGNLYIAEVKHFSFWNCDIGVSGVTLSMTFHSFTGSPLAYTEVRLTDPDGYQSSGWTDSLGQVAGLVPANKNLLMEVQAYPCNETIYPKDLGSFNQNTDLGVMTLNTQSIASIRGKLLNCSNNPVTDGYALIYCNNIVSYVPVNSDGNFTTDIAICPGVVTNCSILPVDDKAKQQGVLTDINLAIPQTDAGNISACGTSIEQYINYTVDGKDYSLTNSPDSLLGSTDFFMGLFHTTIIAVSNPDYIYVMSSHDNSAGTYPLERFGVQNFRDSSIVLLQPSTITFTHFPQTPGEFYEGSLSAKFTDQWVTGPAVHNVRGSFRIRRTQ